jgi:hypothetical protein
MGGGATAPAGAPSAAGEAPAPSAALPGEGCDELVVDDANLINYSQRYDEIVLGRKPINWGNTILIGMIAALVIGGGAYAAIKEKMIRVSFGDTKQPPKGFPADAVDLLPTLARLKSSTRKELRKVLDNPRAAEKAVGLMKDALSQEENKEE